MKNKKYTFGDITFEIESSFELKEDPKFEIFRSDKDADYIVQIRPFEEDSVQSDKIHRDGNVIIKYIPEKYITGVSLTSVFTTSQIADVFPDHDAFILHASYVIHDGKAILFTAPSGTGKSTQAAFWCSERGAEIVNGDRVLITRRNGKFFANGIYVSGTSGISKNITAPIGAVVLLEQGEANAESDIPKRTVFLRILCETSYDMNDIEQYGKVTELVSDLVNNTTNLCYRCKNNPDAVDALERILWNKK